MENSTTMSGAEIRAEIERTNEKFMEMFRQGDAEGIAELYTQDGMVLPPNSDIIEGKQQIKDFWKTAIDMMGIKSVQLQTQEVEPQNNMAYERGRAMIYGEGDQEIDDSKYIVIWKRENGTWKLHRDIFNSSLKQQ